jgi:hypothetical protein
MAIAGHRHRGQCQRHRHTRILYLIPNSSTFQHLKKGVYLFVHCSYWWREKGTLLERPYCWQWNVTVIHIARLKTAAAGVILAIWYRKMPECRSLPVVSCLGQPSAFRHQGSVRYCYFEILANEYLSPVSVFLPVSLTPLNSLSPVSFQNGPNGILGAWGTLIHEKNLKSKISCQTPFNAYRINFVRLWRPPCKNMKLHYSSI